TTAERHSPMPVITAGIINAPIICPAPYDDFGAPRNTRRQANTNPAHANAFKKGWVVRFGGSAGGNFTIVVFIVTSVSYGVLPARRQIFGPALPTSLPTRRRLFI